MLRTASMLTRFEYRLAERLLEAPWFVRSPRKQRLTMHLFRRCARAGHVDALSRYGIMLFHSGASPQDKAAGARFVIRAAEAGDPHAQFQAGCIYERGCAQFVRREDRAVTWYARAAEAGHEEAVRRLARAYRHGELGLPTNIERAGDWEQRIDSHAFQLDGMVAMTH
ncbi:Sel1 repeat-containing protein [Kushneria sinocarnis]|uniref:Sel1 repeat-containing protein n=1 Tax=Kushneria sinocarnis TaxID=595502 RepID=A0A420WXS3_9GAMM|nr:tetratricopeptide repeat protein [Kushneria sinocarnis]RKR04546.1 Sel1 repeat-containing protein [Kushneria sinocarnis]